MSLFNYYDLSKLCGKGGYLTTKRPTQITVDRCLISAHSEGLYILLCEALLLNNIYVRDTQFQLSVSTIDPEVLVVSSSSRFKCARRYKYSQHAFKRIKLRGKRLNKQMIFTLQITFHLPYGWRNEFEVRFCISLFHDCNATFSTIRLTLQTSTIHGNRTTTLRMHHDDCWRELRKLKNKRNCIHLSARFTRVACLAHLCNKKLWVYSHSSLSPYKMRKTLFDALHYTDRTNTCV